MNFKLTYRKHERRPILYVIVVYGGVEIDRDFKHQVGILKARYKDWTIIIKYIR